MKRFGKIALYVVLGAVAFGTVGAVGLVVVSRYVDLAGPTVDSGEWFHVNDIDYFVKVDQNDASGLAITVDARNPGDSPHVAGYAVFAIVARAGDKKSTLDCERTECMYDDLRPDESASYQFHFAIAGPAESIEFVDTRTESPFDRVVLVKLR
jgi:hypothetical protein